MQREDEREKDEREKVIGKRGKGTQRETITTMYIFNIFNHHISTVFIKGSPGQYASLRVSGQK